MSKKILLADDSITIQKVIELTFSDEDFDVVTVGNGRLALEKLPDVKPDIVLCDIIMPEIDGYEVCRRVKSDPQTAHIPVLLLTGAFEPFDQERANRVGSDGFLAKPFEPETLITKVKDLLARAPARPAPPSPVVRAEPPPVSPLRTPPRVAPSDVTAPPLPPAPPPPPAPRTMPEPQPLSASSGFIPEEPFDAFDTEALDVRPSASGEPEPELAPVTPEESATLAGAPEPPSDAAPADAASTVMFRPDDLPWTSPGAQRVPPRPAYGAVPPVLEPEVELEPEPLPVEPEVEPEPYPPSRGPDDSGASGAAFEEVLEEDLEFGTGLPSAPPVAPAADPYETARHAPSPEGGKAAPRSGDDISTGRFQPSDFKPPLATETAPPLPPATREPVLVPRDSPMEPPLGRERHAAPEPEEWKPTPKPAAPEPEEWKPTPKAAAPEPEEWKPTPKAAAPEPQEWKPTPKPAPSVESFADVGPEVAAPEPPAPAPSPAAAVPVPVDMVEKIAQRVVAQVSERVVREIAWEVFPDLAEALIKQEIERLKAELHKL
jgi:CheY-like chemotaxis protein